jgi:uncharacterized protein with HEPN domain
MNERDRSRLSDMLDECLRIQRFIEGRGRADLDHELLSYAVQHSIVLIGEAASQLDETVRQAYPHLPWKNMIGMRNLLIHHYTRANLDVIWVTATQSVSDLLPQLRAILEDRDP